MEAHSRANGGSMTAKDMAGFKAEWVEPIEKKYRSYTVHEIPPNGQGIAALIALGILGNFDLAGMAADGVDVTHLEIEAMKLAFADTYAHVADLAT
nr:gamma-glutamyltransferase [Chenggangzhangella methanolivorans]